MTHITDYLTDGFIEVFDDWSRTHQIWALRRQTRIHSNDKCAVCGLTVGKQAYAPLGNPHNRSRRICVRHVKREDES